MSLFKRKETSFEDMDSQEKLKRIMDQLGFLEKKIDSVLEEMRNRGGSRPSFGGGQRGGFNRDRGGFNRDRGGANRGGQRAEGGNTRYAGQGPRRYNPGRPFGGGNDDNRGNFGGGRPEGRHNSNRHSGPRRPHQGHNQGSNANVGNSSAPEQTAAEESMPE